MTDPIKPYDPDNVSLRTKVERHLRRKGWKKDHTSGLWTHKDSASKRTLTAAIRHQLDAEAQP